MLFRSFSLLLSLSVLIHRKTDSPSFSLFFISLLFFFHSFKYSFKLIFRLNHPVLCMYTYKVFFPKAARPIYFRGPNMTRKVQYTVQKIFTVYLPKRVNVENKY